MDYAIDENGKYVHYNDAKKLTIYKCPHCLEQVFIRTGINACFFHEPIHERTPQQRTCPEYHENSSYKRIDNQLDVIYINNGGIPLYLCSSGKHFELRAYFPSINEQSFNRLKHKETKIYVNTKSNSEIDRRIYSIDNMNFYPVNTIDKWIDVKCVPPISQFEKDIQRKWLWGIRGVDIENDIYHSGKDGGYRVALKANIVVGKAYRIMFDKYPPIINGICFKKIGKIYLKKGLENKVIDIYQMDIKSFTEKAREFIEGKGYSLIEKSNELLPLWPPAVFKGNEIIFSENEAFFLHIDNSKKEKLHFTGYDKLLEVRNNEKGKSIIPFQVNENKSIVVSSESKEMINFEIKYNILYKQSLVEKQPIKQRITIKDSNSIEVDFSNGKLTPPKDGKLYINSNVPFCATVNNRNYVISSSSISFENVDYYRNLIINSEAFGIKNYTYERKNPNIKVDGGIDWELEYSRLYRCTSPTIKSSNRYFRLLYILSLNINHKNIQLYRLLETWIKTNAIPISAKKYIDEICELLGGMVNEK